MKKKKKEESGFKLVTVQNSAFEKRLKDWSALPFYREVEAAIENPKMVVEVKWPHEMNCGQICNAILRVRRRGFPGVRIRTSFRQELRSRGVFQIMYRDKMDDPADDLGEPDREFQIAKHHLYGNE